MANIYKGRYCTNFYCSKVKERRCCVDCWRRKKLKCRNACKNDPARCGLEDIKKKVAK